MRPRLRMSLLISSVLLFCLAAKKPPPSAPRLAVSTVELKVEGGHMAEGTGKDTAVPLELVAVVRVAPGAQPGTAKLVLRRLDSDTDLASSSLVTTSRSTVLEGTLRVDHLGRYRVSVVDGGVTVASRRLDVARVLCAGHTDVRAYEVPEAIVYTEAAGEGLLLAHLLVPSWEPLDEDRAYRLTVSREGEPFGSFTGVSSRFDQMLHKGESGSSGGDPCFWGLVNSGYNVSLPRGAGAWEVRVERDGTTRAQAVRFHTDAAGRVVGPPGGSFTGMGYTHATVETDVDLSFVSSVVEKRPKRGVGDPVVPVDGATMRTIARSVEAAHAWLDLRAAYQTNWVADPSHYRGETQAEYDTRMRGDWQRSGTRNDRERAAARKKDLPILARLTPKYGGPWTAAEDPFAE